MKLLKVAKAALYGLFLNYYCYYVIRGVFFPGGTVLFLGLAGLCIGADIMQRRRIYIGTEIKCWIVYGVLSLITTALVVGVSSGTGYVSDIIKYLQRVAIIMMVAYICEREHSVRFGMQLIAVTAVALAISVIMVMGDYRQKLNITSGANLSENDTGAIMAFGCFAVMYAWGKRGRTAFVLSVLKTAGFICCLVIIFLAGSRKSIYAVAIMLALLLLMCFADYGRKLNVQKILLIAVIGYVTYRFVIVNLLPYVNQTNLYTRLFGRGTESAQASDENRVQLIKWAIEAFISNPLFGLGFNQFTEHYGNYTHSTYFEPLCCSGMIGLLYLYPYYSIIKKQIYLILVNKKGSYARLKQKELFVFLCMALFVAVGVPYMYKDAPCILLGTFIANQQISARELRTMGCTSEDY